MEAPGPRSELKSPDKPFEQVAEEVAMLRRNAHAEAGAEAEKERQAGPSGSIASKRATRLRSVPVDRGSAGLLLGPVKCRAHHGARCRIVRG